jgi:hypothetical protein
MRRWLHNPPSPKLPNLESTQPASEHLGASSGGRGWLSLALGALLIPSAVGAQQQGIIRQGLFGCNFSNGSLLAACIPSFIAHIISFIFMLIGIFFLMSIMFAGYQITIASIQGQDRSKGYNRLLYSIIGFLVAACSYIIMDIVISVVLGI